MRVTPMTPILLTNCGMVKKPEKWSQEANSIKLEGIYETNKQNIVQTRMKGKKTRKEREEKTMHEREKLVSHAKE